MEEHLRSASDAPRDGGRLRWIALSATAMVYLLIVLGGVVRVTGSGLGCPDWPLCYGRFLPPLRVDALIEYVHRLVASVTSPLILATAVLAAVKYRRVGPILWPALASLALLIIQVGLGAVTVLWETPPATVAVHLGVALMILGLQLATTAAAFRLPSVGEKGLAVRPQGTGARLAAVSLGVVFLLMVSGALVAGTGAKAGCAGWPLCDGRIWPRDALGRIHMLHRLLAAAAGFSIPAAAWRLWREPAPAAARVAATVSVTLLVAQVALGALNVLRGFPPLVNGLHVATAAAVWACVVTTAILAALGFRSATDPGQAGSPVPPKASLRDFLALTKPLIVALLLVTTVAGMVVGAGRWPDAGRLAWTLVGGAMAAGGASALNQYVDREIDARMRRTARRPLPDGRLRPEQALSFGLVLCLGAFYVLTLHVNLLSALLALAGTLHYVGLYSLVLKPRTDQNIVLGGGAGAIPPLVGWAAATGRLDLAAYLLFAVVFFWTPAHFWALALLRKMDYARAGIPMLPVVRGGQATRDQILLYAVQVVLLTVMMGALHARGWIFWLAALSLGAGLLGHAFRLWRSEAARAAWGMYRFSSLYLALLFGALILDTLVRI